MLFSSSLFLFKLGLAPQIQDLYGKAKFTGKFVHMDKIQWLVLAFWSGVLPMKISFAVTQIKINVFAFR